ncbi:MAG: 16S rRNA (cytosine(1402)-N(4))-methyltransferase RsmH [Desulfobacterales bacterium]
MRYHHLPAMASEVIDYLNCRPGLTYADCTLGGCGHARRICEQIVPEGTLIGIDQDIDAVENSRDVLKHCRAHVHIVHDNFVNLPGILARLRISAVDGLLLDLGLSLHQIEAGGRGFSFNRDEPLDMRMNTASGVTAAQIVNQESEAGLAAIFKQYGEERHARSIARKIVFAREKEAIGSSGQLARIVIGALPAKARYGRRIHPATRVFMALRIAVNRELDRLQEFLSFAVDYLNPGGRLCVLSFHSLEDRIVKQRFVALARGCTCPPDFPLCVCGKLPQARIVTRKVVRPQPPEVDANPMARSTRLRVLEKLSPAGA